MALSRHVLTSCPTEPYECAPCLPTIPSSHILCRRGWKKKLPLRAWEYINCVDNIFWSCAGSSGKVKGLSVRLMTPSQNLHSRSSPGFLSFHCANIIHEWVQSIPREESGKSTLTLRRQKGCLEIAIAMAKAISPPRQLRRPYDDTAAKDNMDSVSAKRTLHMHRTSGCCFVISSLCV